MDRSIIMLVIGLVFGGGIGFVLAAGNGVTLDGHDHAAHGEQAQNTMAGAKSETSDMASTGEHHDHDEMLMLPEGGEAPSVEVKVTQDAVSGWNLRISTGNFRFAPEHASGAHVAGEGHAHVHVNGRKIARLYGEWLHIAELPSGENRIEVTLNANDHRALAVGGKPVSDAVTVEVK